ncbi:MAG TPA: hypothetical protein VD867_10010 [Burkholderiales bacterium]|nr:hypothetical protein [Burkholderiales bacterium]
MGRLVDFFKSNAITLALDAKRQMLALDRELSDIEKQAQRLEAENLRLQGQVNPLEREIERLRQRIEELQSDSSNHLDEDAEKILQALAGSDGRMPRYETGRHFGLTQARTDHYFDILKERDFIIQNVYTPQPGFGATSEG